MSVSNYEIPFANLPQQFEIVLAGKDYILTNKWNDAPDGGWLIDIADSNGAPIASNIPMITGADLLSGLEYLGIGGKLFVLTSGARPFDVPTLSNLGVESKVYLQVED